MHLSLRTKGKDKCEDDKLDVLTILNNYIEYENLHVRTYINGTLYSILTRPSLKERARVNIFSFISLGIGNGRYAENSYG
jgi:LisH domain-containing protein ARMC9